MKRFIAFAAISCFSGNVYAQATPELFPYETGSQDKNLAITIYKLSKSLVSPSIEAAIAEQKRESGATSVISNTQWEAKKATTLKDALDFTPGVFIQPRNGAEAQRISIRGSGISRTFQGRGIMLMQDGIPVNTADGSFDFQSIDPWAVRYMHVYKGANALVYGASTLGGAINMVTPTGLDEQNNQFRAEAGSFETSHLMYSAGDASDGYDRHASITGFYQGGFRNHNEQASLRFSGNAGRKIDADTETRFYLGYVSTDAQIPGSLTRAQLLADPKAANAPNLAGDFARGLDIMRLANKTAWAASNGQYQSTSFWSYRNLDSPATTYILSSAHDVGQRLHYISNATPHQWRTGINLQYGISDEVRNANNNGQRGTLVVTRDQEALTAEHFIEYDRALSDHLHLIGGVQGAYAMRRIVEIFPATAAQRTNYFGISPRIGSRYDMDSATQLFANISRSFEPPTLSELSAGNTPGFSRLHAQRATTAELGARHTSGNTQWEAAFSRAWVKDEFITYRFPDGSTSSVNAKRTLHDVLELGMAQALSKNLSAQLAYTWSHLRLDDDAMFGDNTLPAIPEHYVRLKLEYEISKGLSISPNMEWTPKGYPVDFANTLHSHPYAIFGLGMRYHIPGTQVALYIDGHNLLGRTYIASTGAIPNAMGADQSQFFPGEGRAVYMGLKLQW
jgi:iron complex outermembrane receptor protein